jgi:hypothetical protein
VTVSGKWKENVMTEIDGILHRIKTYADFAASDADTVLFNVRVMASQPHFESRAYDALGKAKEQLERALRDVSEAITEFKNKPVAA